MPTRPQPLIAPRPNTRKHPLDRFEYAQIDDPIDEPFPNVERRLAWAIAIAFSLGCWAIAVWALL